MRRTGRCGSRWAAARPPAHFARRNSGYSPAVIRTSNISAGLLAFRRKQAIEVLLAHPGGPFWAKKDDGVWSIPKGLIEPGADLFETAQREFAEETNLPPSGEFIALAPVRQQSGKRLHAWAFEADFDLDEFASNTFEMEWPPKSGRLQSFPEVDRIAYFPLPVAALKILHYQHPLLDELQRRLAAGGASR
jgi:predicted NUDIX family NTP pyrophosphohydrolase